MVGLQRGVGVRQGDGFELVSAIELTADPAETRLREGRAFAAETVPLDLLATMMTQYGLDVDIDVASGAEVNRIVLVEEPEDAISIAEAHVRVEAGGVYRQTIVTTGAKLQRIETRITHYAQGAQVQADGLYLLNGARHADLTSVVRHVEHDGATSQLIKGVARGAARGVFQGKIVVERGADGTDARMGHHALIASERAEIDAKPELIIYADDVQCAHGNTVGALDESALFYMQQRGIPADEARALLTQAFLIEVIDRIQHEGAREVAREWLTARL